MTVSPKEFLDKVNNKNLIWFDVFNQKDQLSSTKQNVTQMEKEEIEESTPNEETTNGWLMWKVAWKVVQKAPKIIKKWIDLKNKLVEKGTEKVTQIATETAKAYQQAEQSNEIADELLSKKTDTEAKMAAVDWEYVTNYEKMYSDINNAYLWGKWKSMVSVFEGMKDFWQSTDWNYTYLSDWKRVIKQPTIHSIDTSSLMQSAYDDVTYILANEGRLLTSQEFKELYPEYDNLPESAIDSFISACAYDVLEKWEKTDIQVFADYFWSMSLNDNYVSEQQSILDLLSDESFMNLWWDGLYYTEVQAYTTLAAIANYIRENWANVEWLSDWWILQSYKDIPDKIPLNLDLWDESWNRKVEEVTLKQLLEIVEWIDKKALLNKIDQWKERYDKNIADVALQRKNWEENPQYQILVNIAKNAASYVEDWINEWNTKRAQSWLNRFPDSIIFWNYYVDADGSYYDMNWDILYRLTTNNAGEQIYVDADGERVPELSALRWWFLRSVLTTLTQWNVKATEIPLDISLSKTANEMFEQGMWAQYGNLSTMYATQVLWDVIWAWFSAVMTTPAWLWFQALTSTFHPIDVVYWTVMETIWNIGYWLLNITWLTDWWTDAGKEEFKETLSQIWLMLLWAKRKDIKAAGKELIKKNPKLYAEIEWIKAFWDEFVRRIMWKDSRTMAEYLQRKKWESESIWEKKAREKEVTEWKEVVDVTPVKWQIWVKFSNFAEAYNEAVRAAQAAYENAYVYSAVTRGWMSIFEAFNSLKKMVEWDAEKVDVVNQMEQKFTEAKWEEKVSATQQQEQLWTAINQIANNIVEWLKDIMWTEQTRERPTETTPTPKTTRADRKAEAKLDKALKKTWFDDAQVRTLKNNTYISILNKILERYLREVYDEKRTKRRGKEVIEYVKKEKASAPDIQDMIFEEWYESAKEFIKRTKEAISDMDANTYRILPKQKLYDMFKFWRDWFDWEWKLSEYIRKGEIEFYEDKDWAIKARYAWWERTIDIWVEKAINVLNDILKKYNEATDNWKYLLSEYDILNIRDRIKEYRESSDQLVSMVWNDLYYSYNKFLDTNKYAPILRKTDWIRSEYDEMIKLFDWMFSENGEVRKSARTKLLNMDAKTIAKYEDLWLKWTADMIDLAKNWPAIVNNIEKQLTKLVWNHPALAISVRYWVSWATIFLLNRRLPAMWAFIGYPLWKRFWEWMRKALFKQVPEKKINNVLVDSLKLTDEAKAKIEENRRALKSKIAEYENLYKNMWLEWKAASDLSKKNSLFSPVEKTESTEWTPLSQLEAPGKKIETQNNTVIEELSTLAMEVDETIQEAYDVFKEDLENQINELSKTEWEQKAIAEMKQRLKDLEKWLKDIYWELPPLTDEDVEIQKALDEQIANELSQEWEKPQVVSSEEWKSEAWETKTEESSTNEWKYSNMSTKDLVNMEIDQFTDDWHEQRREMANRRTALAEHPDEALKTLEGWLNDDNLTKRDVEFFSEVVIDTLAHSETNWISSEVTDRIVEVQKKINDKFRKTEINEKTSEMRKDSKKKKNEIKKIMNEISENPEKYNNKPSYKTIARIFELYRELPENMQNDIMDRWLATKYIRSSKDVYSNLPELEKALMDWMEGSLIDNYSYFDPSIWKIVPAYHISPLRWKWIKSVVTKQDLNRIAYRIKEFSNLLNIDITKALKEWWEGEGKILPIFGKKTPKSWTRWLQEWWTRNITFFDNFLTWIHEIWHDITQSLFFDKNPDKAELFKQGSDEVRKSIAKEFGEEYVEWLDLTKMNNWNKLRWRRKDYLTKPTEILSRWLMMRIAEWLWMDLDWFKKDWYWTKSIYESDIKPIIERWMGDARDLFWESSDIATNKIIDELVKEWYFDNMPEFDEAWEFIEEQGMSVSDALMQDPLWPLDKIKEAYYRLNDAINNNETDWFRMEEIKARRDILQRAWIEKTRQND